MPNTYLSSLKILVETKISTIKYEPYNLIKYAKFDIVLVLKLYREPQQIIFIISRRFAD